MLIILVIMLRVHRTYCMCMIGYVIYKLLTMCPAISSRHRPLIPRTPNKYSTYYALGIIP